MGAYDTRTIRQYGPTDRQVGANDLNDMLRRIKRLENMTVASPLELTTGGGNSVLSLNGRIHDMDFVELTADFADDADVTEGEREDPPKTMWGRATAERLFRAPTTYEVETPTDKDEGGWIKGGTDWEIDVYNTTGVPHLKGRRGFVVAAPGDPEGQYIFIPAPGGCKMLANVTAQAFEDETSPLIISLGTSGVPDCGDKMFTIISYPSDGGTGIKNISTTITRLVRLDWQFGIIISAGSTDDIDTKLVEFDDNDTQTAGSITGTGGGICLPCGTGGVCTSGGASVLFELKPEYSVAMEVAWTGGLDNGTVDNTSTCLVVTEL